MNELQIRVQKDIGWHGFRVMMCKDLKNVTEVVTGLTVEQQEPGVRLPTVCIITCNEAQMLFDDLWKAGVRPNNEFGSAGHLESVKYHLEDMRNIAFKQLRIDK